MHDIVVLSDLHMGRGRNPETARYHSLETFFFDEDLRRFCASACADAEARQLKLLVVFNGDTFDLLRFEPESAQATSRREQRFGADRTPRVAASQVRQILEGHPVFVETLADILQRGHEIVILPGNHDIEVQWEPVQRTVREMLDRALATRGARESLRALRFEPWFHYEPGRIWIEHGCQYDPECAFRYPLRGALAGRLNDDGRILELDTPLGNFIQRYLYNGFGPITFIVPSTRANGRYSRWLLFNEPRLLMRVITSHIPFIFQVLRRLAQSGFKDRSVLQQAHEVELDSIAEGSGLGEALHTIDAFKTVEGDLIQTIRQQGRQVIKFVLLALGVALTSAGLWSSGFLVINELSYGVGLKSLLFLLMNFVLMAGAVTLTGMLLRSDPTPSPTPLKVGAQRVINVLDVPVVTFGHTHDENVWRLSRPSGGKAWYFNTGTWIAVFTDDVLLPRERVQYTFLRLRGSEPELLYWNPARAEAFPVILLDDGATETPAPAAEPVPHPAPGTAA